MRDPVDSYNRVGAMNVPGCGDIHGPKLFVFAGSRATITSHTQSFVPSPKHFEASPESVDIVSHGVVGIVTCMCVLA